MDHAPIRAADPMAARRSTRAMLAIAWVGGAVFVVSLAYFLYCYLGPFGWTAAGGSVLRPAAADGLLFSAFAFHHSFFARTHAKAWIADRIPAPLERSIYTWVASLAFIAVCALWQPVPGLLYRWPAGWRLVAHGVEGAGIVLTVFGARALDVLDLAGIRAVLRARTGAPPAHAPLSTTGVFRIVRHPLYFGWALFVWGAADMTATRAVFAGVSCAYVAVAIVWEERGLVDTFGGDYEEYRRRVRWRMIPFVY
ncbi:MAG: methanethiol S-methyltransferase [Acidobacteriota bacterium]|jgi:protein-S-isoprenylcysteine O-methyltransferase Ste14